MIYSLLAPKRVILFSYSSLLIIFVVCFWGLNGRQTPSTGYLVSGSSEVPRLFIPEYDLNISGVDRKGCTYFFLPSYVSLTNLDQSLSDYKLYLPDGTLLRTPALNICIDVVVDTGDGTPVSWQVAFYKSENLNTVFLKSDSGVLDTVTKDTYISVSVCVINAKGDELIDNKPALIKGHGNSTWNIDKNPYELKFPYDVSLCDMRASNKWLLLANSYDSTKMANKLAYDTSEAIGMEYSIESDWVDVYADNSYLGNYLLCKEPDIGNDGLDIGNLEALNTQYWNPNNTFRTEKMHGYIYQTTPAVISGGYLIEKVRPTLYEEKKCGFTTGNDCFSIKSPNNASYEEVDYIRSFTVSVDSTITGRKDDQLSMIDRYSFSRRFLVEELFFNSDSMCSSYYFYKKPGQDRLFAGPIWDHDRALGFDNVDFFLDYNNSIRSIETYNYYDNTQKPLSWDTLLYENRAYRSYLIGVFRENIPVFRELIDDRIDAEYMRIESSLKMDRILWGTERSKYKSAYNNARFIKFYLSKRLEYLCNIWDIDEDFTSCISDGSTHTISFILPDGNNIRLQADDGSQLSLNDLPDYDHEIYQGWYYTQTGYPFSHFIPVFEDTDLELRLISEEN